MRAPATQKYKSRVILACVISETEKKVRARKSQGGWVGFWVGGWLGDAGSVLLWLSEVKALPGGELQFLPTRPSVEQNGIDCEAESVEAKRPEEKQKCHGEILQMSVSKLNSYHQTPFLILNGKYWYYTART